MKTIKHIIWEVVLILSSVLIFRGLWHLMDYVINFNSAEFLVVSSFVGILFAGIALRKLTHAD